MPPHVQLAKQLKQAIDDKASVVDMDDAADVDQAEEEEYPQDFSFDFEGDEGLDDNTRVHDGWEHHLQRLDALRWRLRGAGGICTVTPPPPRRRDSRRSASCALA
ncbi:hypothetical protein PF001_g14918 [Phytophthora fragariae]|uniref:Uncharacterized protein n=1 Tax=Phytophthora fragariae TaxID=53985 RepID=A0A6A3TFS5_9STRA|nr:hypothetical protein PF006_g14581 [Phytophthora fragariae]KAE9300504.1 hypothetical protein PF001_g14918 [Phytophthora fragariae]